MGEERGNVLLRQTQYEISASEARSCTYARNFILGKVYNARWVLERATRDHPQRVPVEQLKQTSAQLGACALCAGAAAGTDFAGRSGRISAVFLEVRCCSCWFS